MNILQIIGLIWFTSIAWIWMVRLEALREKRFLLFVFRLNWVLFLVTTISVAGYVYLVNWSDDDRKDASQKASEAPP